ncbi:hypothetical protein niasHS_013170 [Heterodera schachtii]|uniref:Uncharacterized protein n=1 Tax=Heterodera schachtii TaxID=97005 RepID=A0ABD2ID24_HETSC
MNKIFANDSKAVFEDDMHIGEAFDEVFKQIYEQENEMPFDRLTEIWKEVEHSEKTLVHETNHLLKNQGLQNSIETEMKMLKDAEASLDALKKRELELVRHYKDKQSKLLSSLDHVEHLTQMVDTDIENDQKTLNDILRSYEDELQEMKNLIMAKKRLLSD